MQTIPILELQKILDQTPAPDLIDVRTPVEFASIHVPGAKLFPLEALNPGEVIASRRGPAESPIYVLCKSGARARMAAANFAEHGFENCVVVEGGTDAWMRAGLPVERRGGPRVLPLDRQLQLVMGSIVLTGVVLSKFLNPSWIFLSGFVGAGLIFAGSTGLCPMLRLLARMPWNQVAPAATATSCCATQN